MSNINSITNNLNEKQIEAALSEHKRTLVLAGAGTGKTKVLISRIAYLISIGVDAKSILAVTFTNKAAKEMKTRAIDLINSMVDVEDFYESSLSIGTFHGICNRLLRRHSDLAGLEKDFSVMDGDEQKKLLKEVISDNLESLRIHYNLSDKKEKTKAINSSTNLAYSLIGSLKDEGIRPKDIKDKEEYFRTYNFDIIEVYNKYEEVKDKMHVLDFGDLILTVVELLEANKSLRDHYKLLYRHILVDEFQDTNTIQSKLIDILYDEKESYLFVVGDDDQSIYEWRGAKIENILNFSKINKGTLTVKLEQNYRSTNNILKSANSLIKNNKSRLGKNLWSNKEDGEKIKILSGRNAYDEADKIILNIKRKVLEGYNLNDIAILYRSNYLSRILESSLNTSQLPYTIIGGTGFWSRMEIKDLMSYLSLTINNNNNLAFDRIVNLPNRKIGAKKIEQIKKYADDNGLSRFESLKELIKTKELKGEAGENAKLFSELITSLSDEGIDLGDKLAALLEGSKLIEHYQEKDSEEKGDERELNLNELVNAAKLFKNQNPDEETDQIAFLDYAILQSSNDKKSDGNSLQMMTIHAAKGLEFPIVFLMGWEEGVFPSNKAIEEGNIEEERRLAYVAITRAEKDLYISHAEERYKDQQSGRSIFLSELPNELVTKDSTNKPKDEHFYKKNQDSDWNKDRSEKGYKIGSVYTHSQYGKGIILSVIKNNSNTLEVSVNFKGLVGVKSFFFEI